MVWQRNEGYEQDEILQNKFTAYLLAAVQRRKAQYIDSLMKAQQITTDLDSIYEEFDVNFDLLSALMQREQDEEGKFHIRWGEQLVA